jgi:nucleotide-binding universal stress UspA family protein
MIGRKNILVPTDFELAAEAALRYGRTLAESFRADLHLLHVLDNTASAIGGAPTGSRGE